MNQVPEWRTQLAGDRRVVAFTDDYRNGELWVVAYCKNGRACESLFYFLREEGYRLIARRSPDTLWLGPAGGVQKGSSDFVHR